MTPISGVARVAELADRAAGYGIASIRVGGDVPVAVAEGVTEAAARARPGEGPTFVESRTHRLLGHYNADVEHYRPKVDREAAAAADPLPRLRTRLLSEDLVSDFDLAALEREVEEELQAVDEVALRSPVADAATARTEVVGPIHRRRPPAQPVTEEELTYANAVNRGLQRELRDRPETLIFGEDVAVPGGVFGVTRGLHDEFGAAGVFDTPIAESAILGAAVGAAMKGLRPIVEIMWADFLLVALDQLVNQAANVRYLNRGALSALLAVRCHRARRQAHAPSTARVSRRSWLTYPGCSWEDPPLRRTRTQCFEPHLDPVILIESRALYASKGVVDLGALDPAPFGGRTLHSGDDLTIVTWGRIATLVTDAAAGLAREGIAADVVDMRWLNPLDDEFIGEVGRSHQPRVRRP